MPADLDTLLRRSAPEPSRSLDVDHLLRRAQRRRRGRLLAGATAAVAGAAVIGALSLSLSSPTSVIFEPSDTPDTADAPASTPAPPPASPSPADTPGPTSEADSALPPAPIEGRADAVAAWTGDEVLVWGGELHAEMGAHPDQTLSSELYTEDGADPILIGLVRFDDGAAYRPADGTWRVIASAPFQGGYGDEGVWTGTELLVWSAEEDRLAAYDPVADSWSVLPDPPDPPGSANSRPAVTLVWTGSEAILWGGMDHQAELPAYGVAFDPSTRSWRTLPGAPVPPRQWHTATWTGTEMIIWGGADLVATLHAELGGAAYDPTSNTWRSLPPAPLGGRQMHAAVWTGTEVIVWGGDRTDGLAYDPAADAWRVLPDAPVTLHPGGYVDPVWTGDALMVWTGHVAGEASDTALYDPATDTWSALPPSGLSDRCRAATAWTGTALFAWSGSPACAEGTPPPDGAVIAPAP